jgi:hypothetical protein
MQKTKPSAEKISLYSATNLLSLLDVVAIIFGILSINKLNRMKITHIPIITNTKQTRLMYDSRKPTQ